MTTVPTLVSPSLGLALGWLWVQSISQVPLDNLLPLLTGITRFWPGPAAWSTGQGIPRVPISFGGSE